MQKTERKLQLLRGQAFSFTWNYDVSQENYDFKV